MSEQKFKIGDRVRACPGAPGGGKSGVLVPPITVYTAVPYRIRFDDGGECPLRADEIELVAPKFAFQVGDKVRTANYTPERFVTIEWVGDCSFSGINEKGERKSYDLSGTWQKWVKQYHFPFKVGDRVRPSNGPWSKGLTIHTIPEPTLDWWEDIDGYRYKKESSILGVWELVPEPVKPPAVKRWLVTTEERMPKTGNRYINGCTEILVAAGDHRQTERPVITSVQPLTNLNDWIVGGDGK